MTTTVLRLSINAATVFRADGEQLSLTATGPCTATPTPLAGLPAFNARPRDAGPGASYEPTGLVGSTFDLTVDETGAITAIRWEGTGTVAVIADACARLRDDLAHLDADNQSQLVSALLDTVRAANVPLAITSLSDVMQLVADLGEIVPRLHADDQAAVLGAMRTLVPQADEPS